MKKYSIFNSCGHDYAQESIMGEVTQEEIIRMKFIRTDYMGKRGSSEPHEGHIYTRQKWQACRILAYWNIIGERYTEGGKFPEFKYSYWVKGEATK